MAFADNSIFPEDVSYGTEGGPAFSTIIQESDSGFEVRHARWQSGRGRWDCANRVKELGWMSGLIKFVRARRGSAIGFRFKDWFDFSSGPNGNEAPSTTDATLRVTLSVVGDGVERYFQLTKPYSDGWVTRHRTITRPMRNVATTDAWNGSQYVEITPAVYVWQNGVQKTEGPDWTLDYDTGVIRFATPPDAGHTIEASYVFHVPARFGQEVDDGLAMAYDDYDNFSLRFCPIVEIPDLLEHSEEIDLGGASNINTAANRAILISDGLYQNIAASAAGVDLFLPDTTNLELGGPWFLIRNGGGNTFELYDNLTLVATVTSGQTAELYLGDSGSGKEWLVR